MSKEIKEKTLELVQEQEVKEILQKELQERALGNIKMWHQNYDKMPFLRLHKELDKEKTRLLEDTVNKTGLIIYDDLVNATLLYEMEDWFPYDDTKELRAYLWQVVGNLHDKLLEDSKEMLLEYIEKEF